MIIGLGSAYAVEWMINELFDEGASAATAANLTAGKYCKLWDPFTRWSWLDEFHQRLQYYIV